MRSSVTTTSLLRCDCRDRESVVRVALCVVLWALAAAQVRIVVRVAVVVQSGAGLQYARSVLSAAAVQSLLLGDRIAVLLVRVHAASRTEVLRGRVRVARCVSGAPLAVAESVAFPLGCDQIGGAGDRRETERCCVVTDCRYCFAKFRYASCPINHRVGSGDCCYRESRVVLVRTMRAPVAAHGVLLRRVRHRDCFAQRCAIDCHSSVDLRC
jgi:hypothetical protein